MNPVSFITANHVARPLGYRMTRGWMQGDLANNDLFRPVATFADRFDEMIAGVKCAGFDWIDLWCAHLHPAWATRWHVDIARDVLEKHGVRIATYASHWGETAEDVRAIATLLRPLGCTMISGSLCLLRRDRRELASILGGEGLRLAFENHTEKSAEEMLAVIGEDDADVLGIAFDTGWAGTRGFDAVAAVRQLSRRLFHLHAKDVKARRARQTGFQLMDMGHETCALGDGIVAVEAVVHTALALGFAGPISIEHEPEDHDPDAEIHTSLVRMRQWLSSDNPSYPAEPTLSHLT